eukprot:scaffold2784_cov109-Cylindrotheca_fusiformis.AAC.13
MEDSNKRPRKYDDGLTKKPPPPAQPPVTSFEIHDNPEYVPPDQQDMLLQDVTSALLHSRISEELGGRYFVGRHRRRGSSVGPALRISPFHQQTSHDQRRYTPQETVVDPKDLNTPATNIILSLVIPDRQTPFICEEAIYAGSIGKFLRAHCAANNVCANGELSNG